MRTHSTIITDAGGPAKVAKVIPAASGTVKQWRRLDSIPAPYWQGFADQGIASLEELAAGAARRLPSNDTRLQAKAA